MQGRPDIVMALACHPRLDKIFAGTGGQQGYGDGPSGLISRPVPSRPRPVPVRDGTEIQEEV